VEEICTDHDTRATFSSLAMDNSNIPGVKDATHSVLSVFCQIIGDILAKWLEEQKGRSIVIIERILGNFTSQNMMRELQPRP
jgi:hypothetical protein